LLLPSPLLWGACRAADAAALLLYPPDTGLVSGESPRIPARSAPGSGPECSAGQKRECLLAVRWSRAAGGVVASFGQSGVGRKRALCCLALAPSRKIAGSPPAAPRRPGVSLGSSAEPRTGAPGVFPSHLCHKAALRQRLSRARLSARGRGGRRCGCWRRSQPNRSFSGMTRRGSWSVRRESPRWRRKGE